jgi:hypothetical protein
VFTAHRVYVNFVRRREQSMTQWRAEETWKGERTLRSLILISPFRVDSSMSLPLHPSRMVHVTISRAENARGEWRVVAWPRAEIDGNLACFESFLHSSHRAEIAALKSQPMYRHNIAHSTSQDIQFDRQRVHSSSRPFSLPAT